MKVGFIGTGSMGRTLIESFIESGALEPGQIIASNRTMQKVHQLASQYPGLQIATSNTETVVGSEIIFLCVKPMQFKRVVDEIEPIVQDHQILVSITSPVQILHLEDHLRCKIAKVIPSITNSVLSGATLCIYGSRIKGKDRLLLEDLLQSISRPVIVEENYTRVTSDFSSCGPAFIAFFLQKWIDAAVETTGINREQATCLASEMVLGTGKLLTEGRLTPEEVQTRVAVPGGITAEALHLLENELQGVFHQLIRATHTKYDEDLEKLNVLFNRTEVNRPQY
ncbi:late competence protein ComER [Paenibacillus selenitireducens]|uniref:Pyrroline-5-carboxylate reductase n=1 Tax=Paenibacillus selenitireducens TaxID=1324314 RepID=A0A1T2XEV2_9BACL|nr:late competence protein ComER [Paenibacillus selenitireducens]OPA78370.1 late competence protein ComER [Paenibacillus selenitireducens]